MSVLTVPRPIVLALAAVAAGVSICQAENPVVQTSFTADPAPMVYSGTVYLYTGHDEDDATGFKMLDWKLYTSIDMVNWTDRGTVATLKIFPWAVQSNDAWALQVIERGGKFYLYAPISVAGSPKNVIAVAVADSPLGPFKDALGHPLIDRADGYFDPTVFVDDDGQAYLYWGNPNLWYVKLNKDWSRILGRSPRLIRNLKTTRKALGCIRGTGITTWHTRPIAVRKGLDTRRAQVRPGPGLIRACLWTPIPALPATTLESLTVRDGPISSASTTT